MSSSHCKALSFEFAQLAALYDNIPNISFYSIDCSSHSVNCQFHQIYGVPDFVLCNRHSGSCTKTTGSQTVENMVSFLENRTCLHPSSNFTRIPQASFDAMLTAASDGRCVAVPVTSGPFFSEFREVFRYFQSDPQFLPLAVNLSDSWTVSIFLSSLFLLHSPMLIMMSAVQVQYVYLNQSLNQVTERVKSICSETQAELGPYSSPPSLQDVIEFPLEHFRVFAWRMLKLKLGRLVKLAQANASR
jgi:hypothetical protein